MAVGALPRTMDALSRRAAMLRDSLRRSQGNTDGMVAILGSFDHRLSALEAAMRPTQARPPRPPSHTPIPPIAQLRFHEI
jgi:exocyst complex protein 7